jgi:hypothetical protein
MNNYRGNKFTKKSCSNTTLGDFQENREKKWLYLRYSEGGPYASYFWPHPVGENLGGSGPDPELHQRQIYLARLSLLCLCRPFCIFERCLDSNPESCRSKQARYLLSHPSPFPEHQIPHRNKFPKAPKNFLERLTVNAVVATVLDPSIPGSSDTVGSEGRQINEYWIQYIKKEKKSPF